MRILFVCTGNTCRSPMAAHIAAAKLQARGLRWSVRSAGIAAADGLPMAPYAAQVLSRRGIADYHRSRAIDERRVKSAGIILTMTEAQQDELIRRYPEAAAKTHALLRFIADEDSGRLDLPGAAAGPDSGPSDYPDEVQGGGATAMTAPRPVDPGAGPGSDADAAGNSGAGPRGPGQPGSGNSGPGQQGSGGPSEPWPGGQWAGQYDIVDPIGGSAQTYEACAALLERAIDKLLDKLEAKQEIDRLEGRGGGEPNPGGA